jgi:hypothetical protein
MRIERELMAEPARNLFQDPNAFSDHFRSDAVSGEHHDAGFHLRALIGAPVRRR